MNSKLLIRDILFDGSVDNISDVPKILPGSIVAVGIIDFFVLTNRFTDTGLFETEWSLVGVDVNWIVFVIVGSKVGFIHGLFNLPLEESCRQKLSLSREILPKVFPCSPPVYSKLSLRFILLSSKLTLSPSLLKIDEDRLNT